MKYIKEPEGVDFVINSRPLTKEEQRAISNYIHSYKGKHVRRKKLTKRKKASAKQKQTK